MHHHNACTDWSAHHWRNLVEQCVVVISSLNRMRANPPYPSPHHWLNSCLGPPQLPQSTSSHDCTGLKPRISSSACQLLCSILNAAMLLNRHPCCREISLLVFSGVVDCDCALFLGLDGIDEHWDSSGSPVTKVAESMSSIFELDTTLFYHDFRRICYPHVY